MLLSKSKMLYDKDFVFINGESFRAAGQDASTMPVERPVELKPKAVIGLQEQADIWDRIRRGFALPDLDNSLVRNREQWYASRPDYVQRMTERGNRYLFHIVGRAPGEALKARHGRIKYFDGGSEGRS